MTDRTVLVRLKAEIGQYQANLAKAKDSTAEFGREVSGRGKTARADVEAVGRSALVMGGAMAIGLGKGIQVGMGFEKQMSGVAAVSGATAEEMGRLSDAALAAGASTKLAGVTASDAARAEAELVKAGVSVSDTLGGALMGSLTLAAAGQIDFANAATIAAQAMNIFDLRGGAVTHVADVLAAAANKSAADVGQLGDALRQGGLLAAQTGLSLEETVGTLAAFADNALIGSDAGTSLKTMLQRLTPTSKEAAGLMEELGFSAYDAQGNFIGLEGLAGELRTSLGDMTVEQRNLAMATLFGSDAVRAANILYAEGAEGMREYVQAVDDAGAASRMAAIQNDNLAGDVEALGGAIESALIENGSKANDVMRFMTQSATGLVTGFSTMPDQLQTAAMGMGAIVTAGTLAIGILGTIGPKAKAAQEALDKMGSSGQMLSRNMKNITGGLAALGAGLAVVSTFEAVFGRAAARGQEWAATMAGPVHDFSSYDELKEKLYEVGEASSDLTEQANNTNAPWDADKRTEILAGARGLGEYYQELTRIRALAQDLAPVLGISKDSAVEFVTAQQAAGIDVLADDYDGLKGSLASTFTEMTSGTTGSHALAAGMDVLGSEVMSVEEQVKAFGDTLDVLFDQFFGVESAQDAFQSALNELPDVLKSATEEGLNLNDVLTGHSDAAISVRGHMREMVSGASELIAEWQSQGVVGDELTMRIAVLSQSFRDQAVAAGVPGPVVDHYLGLLAAIPSTKSTSIHANDQASGVIAQVNRQLDGINGRRVSVVVAAQVLGGDKKFMPQYPAAGGLIYRADGGWTPRGTDTVPAMLTPGEFVFQKAAVDRWGVGTLEAMNAGAMFTGGGSSAVSLAPSGSSYVFAPNIVVHAAAGADGRAIGAQIVDELTDWARSNGPLPAAVVGAA